VHSPDSALDVHTRVAGRQLARLFEPDAVAFVMQSTRVIPTKCDSQIVRHLPVHRPHSARRVWREFPIVRMAAE
jgi:hypothetical protein